MVRPLTSAVPDASMSTGLRLNASPQLSPIRGQALPVASAPVAINLAALPSAAPSSSSASSTSTASSVPLVRLTWLFSVLLVVSITLYVVQQLQHFNLAMLVDNTSYHRHMQARFTAAPLASLPSQHATLQHTPAALASPLHAATAPTPYTPTIAILVLGDAHAANRYKQHWASIGCYAHRHNYTFIMHANERPDPPHRCAAYDNFFFRKHCMVAHSMLQQPHIDWWLVLDGDVFVVDAELPLQRWLSSPVANPRLDGEYVITHYERFHNGEIMAGNYIVGNCPRAIDYLLRWADWHSTIPQHAFHNFDNGALQMHLLSYIAGKDSDDYRHVLDMYGRASSWADYDAYVGAFRCVIGPRRLWPSLGLRIVRRGHFAVRDFFVSSEGDRVATVTNIGVLGGGELMFHGWKEAILGVWWAEPVDELHCKTVRDWTPRLVDSVRVDMGELLRVVRERERYTVADRANGVAMQDVSDCFPQCPAELTAAQGAIVRQRLCPPALMDKYVKAEPKAAAAS